MNNGERINEESLDVYKKTVPSNEGKYMGGTTVEICGKMPNGSPDVSGVQEQIAAFNPRSKGRLPRRVLPR